MIDAMWLALGVTLGLVISVALIAVHPAFVILVFFAWTWAGMYAVSV